MTGDLQSVLAHVRATHGLDLSVERSLTGGFQGGARLVHDQHDTALVLKFSHWPGWGADRVAAMVTEARDRGWPTPEWIAWGLMDGDIAYEVQRHLPGSPRGHGDAGYVDALLPVIAAQADRAPSDAVWSWSDVDRRVMFEDLGDLRPRVRDATEPGAALMADLDRWLAPFDGVVLRDTDLVHGDLNPGNVLFDGETLTGVIDVEALSCGSRAHDLATLAIYCWLWGDREVADRPIEAARAFADPGELELTLAGTLVGLLEFGVRHWDRPGLVAACTASRELVARVAGPVAGRPDRPAS